MQNLSRAFLPSLACGLAVFYAGAEAHAHDLVLRGIAIDEQSMEFSLRDEATGEAGWVKLGQSWGNARLVDFDVHTRTLGVKISGRMERLELPKGMILVMPGEAGTTGEAVAAPESIHPSSPEYVRAVAKAEAWARIMEPTPLRVMGRKSSGFTPVTSALSAASDAAPSSPDSGSDGNPSGEGTSGIDNPSVVTPQLAPPGEERYQVVPRRPTSRARS